jgi:soluble lytic murein transglycosylase-like protein
MTIRFSSLMIMAATIYLPMAAVPFVTGHKAVDPRSPAMALHASFEPSVPAKTWDVQADVADEVHTAWKKSFGRNIGKQNRYNGIIRDSLRHWNRVDPLIVKSMMAQESGFAETKRNQYGYVGIMQIGPREAREVGLKTRGRIDERKIPLKAVPASVKLMKRKAKHLHAEAFVRYGLPKGDEYWKFVSAAYNAGEGTMAKAMELAYGNRRPMQVKFKDVLVSKNGDYRATPLYRALPNRWRTAAKYREVSEYAENVIRRARQA